MCEHNRSDRLFHPYTSTLVSWPLFGTAWKSWYQNIKPFSVLLQQAVIEVVVSIRTIRLHFMSTPCSSKIIVTNIPTLSFLTGPVPFVLPSQQCMTAEDTPPYTCHDYWVLIRFACFLMHWLMSCLCPDIQTESLTVYKTVADDNLASSLQTFTSQWVRALAVSD